MPANRGARLRAAVRLGRPVAICLFVASTAQHASAQTSTFVPGTRELYVLDLTGLKKDQLPKGVTVAGQAKPSVVVKDGVPMLQATERTEIVFHLPEALPSAFTVQVVITPKATGAPEDVSFEGTPEVNRGDASMQVVWQTPTLIAAGGGEVFQMAMPDSIALTLPLRPVPIDLSFDGGAFRLFTDGKLLMDLSNRQFVRGRVLRVTLGGGCDEPGKCISPDSIEKYSVYLSKLRIAAGGGVVANQNTQSTSQSTSPSTTQSLSQPPNRNTIPKTFAVTVISGPNGPVVSWPPVTGASGYAVSRSKVDDATCCNNASGSTYGAVSPWQDKPLPLTGTYLYRVVASTPIGQISGETQFGFRKPEVGIATTTTTTMTGVLADPAPTTGSITPATTTPPSTTTKTTMVDRTAPLNVATGPAPRYLRLLGSPNVVRADWDSVPGAVSYNLSLAPVGTTTWTALATSADPANRMWEGSLPDPTKTYTYQVVAVQGDGKMGATTADYKTPTMEPTHFSATAIAPGQVRFDWDDIENQFEPSLRTNSSSYPKTAGPITYFLSGPGAGTGLRIPSAPSSVLLGEPRNTFTLTGVPAGTQTWTLTVDWDPGGVITPSTSWPKASATVVPDPLPRYRLVALGFKAIQQSKDIDDAHDGHGDEVYFSAIVNRTRLTGDSLPVTKGANLTMVMTRSHGDEAVSVPYGRIKAGTASPTGGIKSGDAVPASLDPGASTGTLQTLTFPLVLWEGELGDSDVVIVHSTLWEDDVNPVVQATWAKSIIEAAGSGYVVRPAPSCGTSDCYALVFPIDPDTAFHRTAALIAKLNVLSLKPGAGILGIANGLEPDLGKSGLHGDMIFMCTVGAVNLTRRPCEAHGVDRPIGLEAYNTNGTVAWTDRLIFLSRASVAAALSGTQYAPYMAWPRGTFSIKLRDQISSTPLDIEAIASYDLFFRIEKVP